MATDWTCNPGYTYKESPSQALANFTWIITASPWDNTTDFTISSANDPFAFAFANASLAVNDQNSAMERYTFKTLVEPVIVPEIGVNCHYTGTVLEAALYTRRSKTYPAAPSASSSTSATNPSSTGSAMVASEDSFAPWQFAVEITLNVGGGPDIPACYQMNNNARLINGLVPQPASSVCSCGYKNFDP